MKDFFNKIARTFSSDINIVGNDGFTKLQRAVLNNDMNRVMSLIQSGADINLRGQLLFPPLHLALERENKNIALLLLQAGADVNLQDIQGQTPLHKAALTGSETFTHALLKMGANPNLRDNNGQTPLHIVSPSAPDIIDTMIAHKADPNMQDLRGNTPLHLFLQREKMLEKLLTGGANPNIKNKSGMSPYMMMLEEDMVVRFPGALQKFLAYRADFGSTNQMGETLLQVAGRLELREAFDQALESSALDATDANGNTVLHALVRVRNVGMIQKVLEKAPGLVHKKNANGMTPLDELVDRAEMPPWHINTLFVLIVQSMVQSGADINARDSNGMTLLHHAVKQNKIALLEYLMGKGIDSSLRDKSGLAALHVAIDTKNIATLDRLLDLGADPDLTDHLGWTVLDRLAEKGDRDSPVVQRLIVASGEYKKQLPLNPELMRKKPANLNKGGVTLQKPLLPKPNLGDDPF